MHKVRKGEKELISPHFTSNTLLLIINFYAKIYLLLLLSKQVNMDNLGLLSEPKNILELFTFDLTTFFYEEDFEEIDCYEEKGVFMVEYKKNLPWLELDFFDHVVFRVFNDKENIVGSSHINVKMPANVQFQTNELVKKLTNTLFNLYGWDDESKGDWIETDTSAFKIGQLTRTWTLGEGKYVYTVKLQQDENKGVLLQILFFNHLLKLNNQTISFPGNEFDS